MDPARIAKSEYSLVPLRGRRTSASVLTSGNSRYATLCEASHTLQNRQHGTRFAGTLAQVSGMQHATQLGGAFSRPESNGAEQCQRALPQQEWIAAISQRFMTAALSTPTSQSVDCTYAGWRWLCSASTSSGTRTRAATAHSDSRWRIDARSDSCESQQRK